MNAGEKSGVSRRRHLTLAEGAIGVTTLVCCGATALGSQQPAVTFVESACGSENQLNEKDEKERRQLKWIT
jgi:hypothetical protein